ncbi:MAG: zinc ribbon domain-containing protein [Salinispira sp.]
MMVHFFCENCGSKVRSRDKICPKCGKFFYQVRCSNCNHEGAVERFLRGCPICGYREDQPPQQPQQQAFPGYNTELYNTRAPVAERNMLTDWIFTVLGVCIFIGFMVAVLIYIY